MGGESPKRTEYFIERVEAFRGRGGELRFVLIGWLRFGKSIPDTRNIFPGNSGSSLKCVSRRAGKGPETNEVAVCARDSWFRTFLRGSARIV
jgi:hypothetical protein